MRKMQEILYRQPSTGAAEQYRQILWITPNSVIDELECLITMFQNRHDTMPAYGVMLDEAVHWRTLQWVLERSNDGKLFKVAVCRNANLVAKVADRKKSFAGFLHCHTVENGFFSAQVGEYRLSADYLVLPNATQAQAEAAQWLCADYGLHTTVIVPEREQSAMLQSAVGRFPP